MTLGVGRAALGEATLKNGSGRLFEPLIYHGFSGQGRPSAVEQLSNRVVWSDGSRKRDTVDWELNSGVNWRYITDNVSLTPKKAN